MKNNIDKPLSSVPDPQSEGMGNVTNCLTLRYFGGLKWAVFNCSDYDKKKGRAAVKASFGSEGWEKVRESTKSGIMEIFRHPQTPETKLYAETVGQSADRRAYLNSTAKCPDCGGDTFRDESRINWCHDCGWNKSP